MTESVCIGIIGAGWVVKNRHLPALKKLPDVQIRTIWSRDPGKGHQVAAEFGIPQVAGRWQNIATSPELDAVIIGTPPILHLPATAAALESGKHVLCQARMARNLAEAREMLRLSQTTDRVTALYPPKPGLKGDRVMHRLLHEERFVGEIREVRVTGMALLAGPAAYAWTADPTVTGVNAMTLGLWNEVLNRWVAPATRVTASARIHNRMRRTAGVNGSRPRCPIHWQSLQNSSAVPQPVTTSPVVLRMDRGTPSRSMAHRVHSSTSFSSSGSWARRVTILNYTRSPYPRTRNARKPLTPSSCVPFARARRFLLPLRKESATWNSVRRLPLLPRRERPCLCRRPAR